MKSKSISQIAIGVVLGFIITLLGMFIFSLVIDKGSFFPTLKYLYYHEALGRTITMGALLNIVLVYFLFRKNKDEMVKGVIYSLVLITLITLITFFV